MFCFIFGFLILIAWFGFGVGLFVSLLFGGFLVHKYNKSDDEQV